MQEIMQEKMMEGNMIPPEGYTEGVMPTGAVMPWPPEVDECVRQKTAPTETFQEFGVTRTTTSFSEIDIQRIATICMEELGVEQQGMMTPPPEGMTAPLEMMGTIPPEMMGEICEKFALAPSCDYVPVEVRDLCRQCKQ